MKRKTFLVCFSHVTIYLHYYQNSTNQSIRLVVLCSERSSWHAKYDSTLLNLSALSICVYLLLVLNFHCWLFVVLKFLTNILKLSELLLGTGKGSTSIWGDKFEDEFHESLRVCVF